MRTGKEYPGLHGHPHGGCRLVEEGGHRPLGGLALQGGEQPTQCDKQQGYHERGVQHEERLGDRAATCPEG